MYVKALISILIFLSCTEVKEESSFFEETNKRWFAGVDIREFNEGKKILELDFIGADFKLHTDCIFYEKRTGKRAGRLWVSPKNTKCNEQSTPYKKISELFNFSYELRGNQLMLSIDKQELSYTLLNHGDYQRELYKGALRKTSLEGVLFASNIFYTKGAKKIVSGEYCRKVEHDCSESIFNSCNNCESGVWYEVFDSRCERKYSRICGRNPCGQKNMPACIRGIKTTRAETRFYCIADSPFAFCDEGLRVFCENNSLTCK